MSQTVSLSVPSSLEAETIGYVHRQERPRPLARVAPGSPEALQSLVYRMLEKEKAKYPGMREVAAILETLIR